MKNFNKLSREQKAFLRALDDEGLRPIIAEIAQDIVKGAEQAANYVNSPDSRIIKRRRPFVAGAIRYGADPLEAIALKHELRIIPNAYRTTIMFDKHIFQVRRFRSATDPIIYSRSKIQMELGLSFTSSRQVVLLGPLFPVGKYERPDGVLLGVWQDDLKTWAFEPIPVSRYFANEHLQEDAVPKARKVAPIKTEINKRIDEQQTARRRRLSKE